MFSFNALEQMRHDRRRRRCAGIFIVRRSRSSDWQRGRFVEIPRELAPSQRPLVIRRARVGCKCVGVCRECPESESLPTLVPILDRVDGRPPGAGRVFRGKTRKTRRFSTTEGAGGGAKNRRKKYEIKNIGREKERHTLVNISPSHACDDLQRRPNHQNAGEQRRLLNAKGRGGGARGRERKR